MKGRTILATLGLVSLVVAANAQAQRPDTVPPGNSQVDQYTETLPGPSGDEPTIGGDGGGGDDSDAGAGSSNPVLSPEAAAALEALGAPGVATAAAAEASAPPGGAGSSSRADGEASAGRLDRSAANAAAGDPPSPISTAIGALTTSDPDGGLGIWLLVAIIAVGGLACLGVVLRRRIGSAA
jgi:hypothetical protein